MVDVDLNWMWMAIAVSYVSDPEPLFTMRTRIRSILNVASVNRSMLEVMQQTAIPAFVDKFVREDFRKLDKVEFLAEMTDSFIAVTHRLVQGSTQTAQTTRQQMVQDILRVVATHGRCMAGIRCELGLRALNATMTWEFASIKYGIAVPPDVNPRTVCNADRAVDMAYHAWGSLAAMQRALLEDKHRDAVVAQQRERRVARVHERLGVVQSPGDGAVDGHGNECVWSFSSILRWVRPVRSLYRQFLKDGDGIDGVGIDGGEIDDGVGVDGAVDDEVDGAVDGAVDGEIVGAVGIDGTLLDRLQTAYDGAMSARTARMHDIARTVRGHVHLLRRCMHACPCDFSTLPLQEADVLGSHNAVVLNRCGGGLSVHSHVYVVSGSSSVLRRIEQYVARLTYTLTHIWPPPGTDLSVCNIPYEVPWAINATISYLGASSLIGAVGAEGAEGAVESHSQGSAALRSVAATYRACVSTWLDYNQTVAWSDSTNVRHIGEEVFVHALRGYMLPPLSAAHVLRTAMMLDHFNMVAEVHRTSHSLISSCDIGDHLGTVVAEAGFMGCTRADAIRMTIEKIAQLITIT